MTYSSSMAGLGASMNTYNGPVPPGVPNPFTVMLHSYPTRFHGPIYTRPQFGLEWAQRPNDFGLQDGMLGLGALTDVFKGEDTIKTECQAMFGDNAERVAACMEWRGESKKSAIAGVLAGVVVGALGMHLYMRKR